EATMYESVSSLVQDASRHDPVVIVLGPSVSPQVLVEHLEPLLKVRADHGAVMVVHPLSPEMVRSAFRAGVDDVVTADGADTELLGAIMRSASRIRAHSEDARPPAVTNAPLPPTSHRRVVTVFGTKGGVGKSVVAVNLAVALARQSAQPTVLVDANLQFGDAAIMLQLPPAHTITEVALAGDRLDGELLDGLLLRHEPSGLLLLAAPPNPEAADQIGRSNLANAITVLRERCVYVVIDTSPRIEESTLVALEAADDILLLTNLDVTSLKDARLALQTLQALGIQQTKVRLVLNRSNTQGGLTRADAGRSVRMKVTTALPSDPLVADSVNRGMPMVLSAPTSKFALTVDELARALRARSSANAT
ncbi:MAG TPA: AAA family ATPase, partial [Acidimicrobiales bacterium]|nr:AAA family ATPase [Acidimicrobiales bacterium]